MSGSIFRKRVLYAALSTLAFSLSSAFFIYLFPPVSYAAQVSLAWDPSTSTNVAGYKVHYGAGSNSYEYVNDAGNNTTITISSLQDGSPYYFAVTAYDPAGVESSFSNEVVYHATLACPFAIAPSSQPVAFSDGGGTVNISTQSGCTWTAVSNVSWLVITSNSSGVGSGTVNYSVNANPSTSSRTGTLTVAGQTFTVTQSGAPQYASSTTSPSTFVITATGGANGSISPSGPVTVEYGGSQSFTITPKDGCKIANVKVDGISVGKPTSYLFGNIKSNHTIVVNFAPNAVGRNK